ncbi:uncharacterized protein LOC107854994 [Capsicum annuum]|uniref:uncharacterized protein LOC107854994 n=1 Tax=Capsicum annuum TaxID=4072 RepID=UPI001FB14915|nr:uncharacterized protein LOC107854994 [Capsicum annuum]
MNVLNPIERRIPNPPPKNLDYSRRCEYCSDAPGHNTKKYWYLKIAIQELINTQQIMVESSDAPNVNQNPLPDHNKTNMLEVILSGEDAMILFKPIIKIKTDSEKSANVVDLTKEKPAEAEVVITKPESSNVPLVVGKEISENIGSSQINPKLIIPERSNKPFLIIKGAPIASIVIKPVSQLPMVDTKVVPWNYDHVVVMHKGKEVTEDIDEVGGLTQFGRYYAPVELRKNKKGNEERMTVKKPVTDEEAEEFLKKMKLPEHFVVEQLKKTPTHISLLSSLMHSEVHRKAIMKILNEACVPSEIKVNQLEKVVERILKANKITFSDDELPVEGTEHNKGLYITVKCEHSIVTRVLIDGGSGANICPISTLQMLNINVERIRPNNVCVKGFDGSKIDAIGEIEFILTIGPVDFAMDYQVLNIDASYNMLLVRPWIHRAKAVASTLHQMLNSNETGKR